MSESFGAVECTDGLAERNRATAFMPSRDRRDGTGCAPGRCMAGRRASPELRLFAGGVRRTTDGAEATGAELQAAPSRASLN